MKNNPLSDQSALATETPRDSFRSVQKRRNALPEASSAEQLHRYTEPVAHNSPCSKVIDYFLKNSALSAIPTIDYENRPCALIERHSFIEFFSRPFSRELHAKKTIEQLVEITSAIDCQPMTVDISTTLDDIAQILIADGPQRIDSGFIETVEGGYADVANAHDLLHQLTQRKQFELYHLAHYSGIDAWHRRHQTRVGLVRAAQS